MKLRVWDTVSMPLTLAKMTLCPGPVWPRARWSQISTTTAIVPVTASSQRRWHEKPGGLICPARVIGGGAGREDQEEDRRSA